MNNTIPRVLVIEDDPDGLRSICEAIQDAGYAVMTAATGAEGLAAAQREAVDVVLSDLILPDMDGLKVLDGIHAFNPTVPILIMTAYGSVDTAVRAIKAGAYDYLVKPLDLEDVQAKLGRALEASQLRAQVARLRSEVRGKYSARSMVAGAPVMVDLLRQIETVANTHATVLVLGESGAGKELVARALHADGKRSAGPFVAVNCGAFAESLLESELFGHEKGSFTGASMRHEGAFERANGGTLFLDEIGIAPKSVQTRLLRALEEKEVLRVGGREPIAIDARIVAASNRDLDELVEAGEFRQDLLYRLQVVTLRLPPLRARREDIRELTNRFVAAACAEHGRHIEAVDSACYERLEQHEWPGNIRELRNVVESAVIMAPGPVLRGDDLRFGKGEPGNRGPINLPNGLTLADLEREALLQALRRHAGNRQLTADELGISTRTIQRKIRDYDLPF